MTTPEERFRAIQWAREWLQTVVECAELPEDLRQRAAQALSAIPTEARLLAVIENSRHGLPHDVAQALADAAGFVHETWLPEGSEDLSEFQRRIRRHLPSTAEVLSRRIDERAEARLGKTGLLLELRWWISPPDG